MRRGVPPKVREVPGGEDSRRVKSSTVAEVKIGEPPRNIHSAKRARSGAGAKRPACPATPSMTKAFSSLTSPWMMRRRKVRSSSVAECQFPICTVD